VQRVVPSERKASKYRPYGLRAMLPVKKQKNIKLFAFCGVRNPSTIKLGMVIENAGTFKS